MIIFKNIFSFILTFYAYNWLIKGGIQHTMIVISIVQVVVCVLSIPMCMSPFKVPWPALHVSHSLIGGR